MGAYTTEPITEKNYKSLIRIIREGYGDHKPNPQVATILVLEANLGCRIGDVVALRCDSFTEENGTWRLDIIEDKTEKKRFFIVPKPVKSVIDGWIEEHQLSGHDKLFTIKAGAVWKAMRNATEWLELQNTSTHSLRKMAGLKVYESSGKDIALTCAFYQHRNPATTMLYLRRSSKQMDEALTKAVSLA